MKKEKVKIETLLEGWTIIKNNAELIMSGLALIISLLVALINFLYNHFKDKDYVEVRFANPIYYSDTVYINEMNNAEIISPHGGSYFTWIYVTNASNHDVGYYSYEMYLNGKQLSRMNPNENYPLYVKDNGGKVPISYANDLSNGNITSRSQVRLSIASTGYGNPIIPYKENEITISLTFIKANFWSFLPIIGRKMNHSKIITHKFKGSDVKDNPAEALLDMPIVKRM